MIEIGIWNQIVIIALISILIFLNSFIVVRTFKAKLSAISNPSEDNKRLQRGASASELTTIMLVLLLLSLAIIISLQ